MPNGHGQRWEDEKKLIAAVEKEGWELYESPPDWIIDAAKSDGIPRATAGFNAAKQTYHGDNYIYLAVSSVHGNSVHVFSQKKSEYSETINWNPREQMERWEYAKFKHGIWVEVESFPEWVNNAINESRDRTSQISFFEKTFSGNSVEYKIEVIADSHHWGDITDIKRYARVKK